ncbi:MAG TPA: phosphoribosyltransferase family protein [Myxococcaceae bacterium]|nr:phosphoribosyltransferase family protein [Myxococcaceae bacterium]
MKKTRPAEPKRSTQAKPKAASAAKAPKAKKRQAPAEDYRGAPRGQDRSRQKGTVREWSWSDFDRAVQALARNVTGDYRPDAVVGIAHGGVFVGAALARAMVCDFFPVRISRRSRDQVVRRAPKSFQEMPAQLKGKRVLLADDVVASGDTLELARALLAKVGAKEVRSACLIGRDQYEVDWAAVIADELFVFPWDYMPLVEDGRFGEG